MDPSQTLRLRCTDRLVPTGAPDLAPFLRGARTVDPERDEVLTWIAPRHVVPGTCGLRARERAARIPVSTPRLDLAAFAVGVRTHLPAPSPRALALAAALPLALSPALARAQSADDEATAVGPEDPSAPDPAADEGPVEAAAPSTPDDLSYGGVRLWEAVRGARVQIVIDGDTTLTGTVLAQADGEIAIAREPDGAVMRVPKEVILGLRVIPPPLVDATGRAVQPEKPPRSGRTMAAIGGVLTGLGAGMMTAFAVGTSVDGSFAYYGFPLMILGPTLLGPGIPLLTTGLALEEGRHNWMVEHEMQVSSGPIRGGWSGRVSIRF